MNRLFSLLNTMMLILLSRSVYLPILGLHGRRTAARHLSLAMSTKSSVPVEIPLTDTREYAMVTLKNALRCIVVSDSTSEKSAAAIVLRAGAALDPPDHPGMAHFTEHMLFLGSEKFPKENSYKEYLSKHGGSSNGATGMEYTSYYFGVNAANFEGALDIFAQFFVNPSFNNDAVFREVQVIYSFQFQTFSLCLYLYVAQFSLVGC